VSRGQPARAGRLGECSFVLAGYSAAYPGRRLDCAKVRDTESVFADAADGYVMAL